MGHDRFYNIAMASMITSMVSLAILAVALPMLYSKSDMAMQNVVDKSEQLKVTTDLIWLEIVELRQGGAVPNVQFFSRSKRAPYGGGGFCKGCFTLSCPQGSPGPPGAPGPDGQPGDAGRQGRAGEDGFDIQPESEQELPCVICPAGPPGPRGAQGERGMTGNPGMPGLQGPNGIEGVDGPPGLQGPLGPRGEKGPLGARGLPGDTVVAGVGIKGPIGPPGPQGMKGPPGPPGKGSNQPGQPGQPGNVGAIGQTGKMGPYGLEGPAGAPGDPGMPASYCPSDCGVQNILTDMFPHPQVPESQSAYSQGSSPAAFPKPKVRTQPAHTADPSGEAYYNRMHDFQDFERKWRRKLLQKRMRMNKH